MSIELKAKITRAAYLPHVKPGYTEITIEVPGQVDLVRGDAVVVVVKEGKK